MAVTMTMYSNFPHKLLEQDYSDFSAASKIKCMLCTSSYTPNQETHTTKSDVDNEVSGTGYTAGGVYLTSPTCTEATKVTTFDAADAEWESSTITARYAVLYDEAATDDPLILWIDFGADVSSNNGTFKIEWDASGIFTFTVP